MNSSPFDFSAPQPSRAARPFQMAYWEFYSFLFDHPNWLLNWLLAMVCQFIPIVGPIVLLGYEYEVILSLHRRNDRYYPEFDFGRFTDYLGRGIWPFLVNLIQVMIGLPIFYGVLIAMFLAFGFGIAGTMPQGQNPNDLVALAILPVMFLFMIGFSLIMGFVSLPMLLRAGLTQEFGEAFNYRFVKEFISLVWWEMILSFLFLFATAPFIMLAGMLVCFVGIYPAGTLLFLAFTHMKWQLYELYLSRGGTPIPIPEDDIYDAVVA